MIKITAFHRLPMEEQRIGSVISIDNSYPRNVGKVHDRIKFLAPPRKVGKAYRQRRKAGPRRIIHPDGSEEVTDEEAITWEDFKAAYRAHLRRNWRQVSHWLQSLDERDEVYLCTWTTQGKDHRHLIAELIKKFRPELKVRLT